MNTVSTPEVSTWGAFLATLRRDLLVAFKRRNDLLNPIMFFLIVVTLFPLGVSPDPAELTRIAAGVVWVSALLASMLSLDNLYRADYEDGSLEQLLLSPQPLFFLVLAKNIAHWLISGLPVVVLSPLLAYMLYLPTEAYWTLVLTLLIGTPVLSLFGSIGVALTVGLGSRGLILAVIVLPLTMPVLIIGAKAVTDVMFGLPVGSHFALLGAMLAVALSIAPLASAAALRISVS
ncbi:heme exporter protein CcmB [Pseudohongiella sp.]|uniref:Heme exporter protein B n=1 Tax=marine sediment metagenome TaxID=412755 RepID=A0A0F9YEQ5_9ZZZZ|nr:heme exporter protein CcmB [Pseudohongiella sp.]HDZ09922.1 heme exporter protein CcmB [Pseudohongiella sp.]HEA63668.1 heme exporter protein CcmB [Pseudohongiella sp.]